MTFDDPASAGQELPVSSRLERLWGCGDIDALFGGHVQVSTPWPSAPRRKHGPSIDRAAITALLEQEVDLVDVDPRTLHAGQPWVLRHHVTHYLTGEWERTGRTSADRHLALNQFPVVASDHRGRAVIVAGHHRAAAALITGAPLRVRIAARSTRAAITPLLFVDETHAADASAALGRVAAGHTATVGSVADAAVVLDGLGLDEVEIRSRLALVRRSAPAPGPRQEGA